MEAGLEKGKPPEKMGHKATGPKDRLSRRRTDEKKTTFSLVVLALTLLSFRVVARRTTGQEAVKTDNTHASLNIMRLDYPFLQTWEEVSVTWSFRVT